MAYPLTIPLFDLDTVKIITKDLYSVKIIIDYIKGLILIFLNM